MKFEDKFMLAIMADSLHGKQKNTNIEVSIKVNENGVSEVKVDASMVDSIVCVAELIKAISESVKAEPEEVLRTIGYGMGIRL